MSSCDPALRTAGRPISPRDRYWSTYRVATTYGPLHLPAVDDLRRAASLLAQQWPASRIGVRLDRARGMWVDHPDGLEVGGAAAVVVDDSGDLLARGVDAHTASVVTDAADDVSVKFMISGSYLTCYLNHAVGDASIVLPLVPALVTTALTGHVPDAVLRQPVKHPLLRALAHTASRHPGLLRAAVGRPQTPPAQLPDGACAAEGATTEVTGAMDVRHAVMSAASVRDLRSWRLERAPGASTAAVLLFLARTCLVDVGLPPTGAPGVLVDLRRYLPAQTAYWGNFAAGLTIGSGETWDPAALTRHLQADLRSARPLRNVARGEVLGHAEGLKTRLLRREPTLHGPAPAAGSSLAIAEHPRPSLTISSVPRSPARDALPWAAPAAECTMASVLSTGSPRAITLSVSELRGHLHLSMTHSAGAFDCALIAEAVHLMAADPVGVLRGGQG